MSLLGIDVGTSGCKAAVFDPDGRCLSLACREYSPVSPRPGWFELDSRVVTALVFEAIAEAVSRAADDPVTALCVSSLGEAMTPVDAGRRILGNSILMADQRGGDLVESVLEVLGSEAFYRINRNFPGSSYSLPKLLWLKQNQRELYDRTDRFLMWSDWIAYALGGEAVTSYSLASRTLLFDLQTGTWSPELLRLSGIDAGKLAMPCPSGTVIGEVSPAMAKQLNLPAGVRIVVGGHDQCCNALGAGIGSAGRAVCGIGSFECLTPVYDHVPPAEPMMRHGLNVEHHILPGLYVSFIYNQAGLLVKWFRNTFAQEAALDGAYARLDAEMPVEPTRLMVLPYFDVTGPPEFVGDASGVIAGLKMGTTRGEILKAILEGETFYFAAGLDALRDLGISTTEFVATGGGARSDKWLQIKADIFGVPFVRPRFTEGSLLGAAILAGVATGVFREVEEGVRRFVSRERIFDPDPVRHAFYQERYQKYRTLFPLMRDYLKHL
ncbi:MAG: FGGY family carbohydrate kinase [bacterium]